MSNESTTAAGMNRAKPYQLVLFPFNNGATNVYYILTITYIAYYGNGVLGLALMFATTMVTVMRLFDAVTDPIIGALIDKTNGRFGKFRPYMVLGGAGGVGYSSSSRRQPWLYGFPILPIFSYPFQSSIQRMSLCILFLFFCPIL